MREFFENLPLRTKLLVAFLSLSIIPFLILGILALSYTSSSLEKEIIEKLEGTREIKKSNIETYFKNNEGDIKALSKIVEIAQQQGLSTLEQVNSVKKPAVETYFKEVAKRLTIFNYTDPIVRQNTSKLKDTFLRKDMQISWNQARKECDQWFSNMITRVKADNGLFISPAGDVVYAPPNASEAGINLLSGTWKNSTLSEFFIQCQREEKVYFKDFHVCLMHKNFPQAFAGFPVFDAERQLQGVVMMFVYISRMNDITYERTPNIESYFVGPDKKFRSDLASDIQKRSSFASFQGTVEENGANTEVVQQALMGNSVSGIYQDYNKQFVLTSAVPLDILGERWALVSQIPLDKGIDLKNTKNESYFVEFEKQYNYHDILFFANNGYCFHSVAGEADRYTNLVDGPYKNTNLGRLIQNVIANKKLEVVDFEPYAPSKNRVSSFSACPIFNASGNKLDMIVALQLNVDQISSYMQMRQGLGATGESYLIGKDGLVRSNLALDTNITVENSFADPLKYRLQSESIREALANKAETKVTKNYKNRSVLSSYSPVKISDNITWAIITEMSTDEAFAGVSKIRNLMYILGLIGIIAVLFVGYKISSSIGEPIMAAVDQISSTTEQLTNAAKQMSGSSQQISQGSIEQASTLEEISSSLEEITSMTQQNAHNCADTEKLSNKTKNSADEGKTKLSTLEKAIAALEHSSAEMEKIMKNIQEIAMQTNMLSLNAAVEAARAGEHGRGFAVVADEVRSLAQKSAEFSKATNKIIRENAARIDDCAKDVKESTILFQEIFSETDKVHDLIGDISAASREQAQGLEQVTKSITDMDKVVQSNASSSEEQASIAEELEAQAEGLDAIVKTLAAALGIKSNQ